MLKKILLMASLFIVVFSTMAFAAEKPEVIDLVLILDKSGSMHGLEADTIGGFNAMIEKEKKEQLPVKVTTVLFNNSEQVLYERKDIGSVPELTNKDYVTGGTTALLDALGDTLSRMDSVNCLPEKRKVIVVITTDGKENASREFTKDKIKEMVAELQAEKNWEFIFLGANIDAIGEAGSLGITHAAKYQNDGEGVRQNFEAVSVLVTDAASGKSAEESTWKDEVKQAEN